MALLDEIDVNNAEALYIMLDTVDNRIQQELDVFIVATYLNKYRSHKLRFIQT